MCEWFGMVRGVRVPSEFSRTIAICSRSRTMRNPTDSRARTTFRFGASTGNLGMGLGDERLQDRRVGFPRVREGLQVETDSRLAVGQRGIVGITLANHYAFHAERISNISIGMLFHHDFPCLHATNVIPSPCKSPTITSDKGLTWSTPIRINQTPFNPAPLNRQAFYPVVASGVAAQVHLFR